VNDSELPFSFPLRDRVDLLLDAERIDEALEYCEVTGSSLEVRSPEG